MIRPSEIFSDGLTIKYLDGSLYFYACTSLFSKLFMPDSQRQKVRNPAVTPESGGFAKVFICDIRRVLIENQPTLLNLNRLHLKAV
ncbi:hypothetical protein BV914_07665 [Neisseria dumasiana]|nr:hypothetical protein BV914_07665 [Neisseria dumasiana]